MERQIGSLSKSFVMLLLATLIGCASIIAGGPQTVPIKSTPPDARLKIVDLRKGSPVYEGKTPYTITLDRGAGYFKKARYNVIIEKDGYKTKEVLLEGSPNGWYVAGNLIFGGLPGWFIVDPLTGAMWTLQPKDIDVELKKKLALFQQDEGLTVVLTTELPELPASIKDKMRPVEVK